MAVNRRDNRGKARPAWLKAAIFAACFIALYLALQPTFRRMAEEKRQIEEYNMRQRRSRDSLMKVLDARHKRLMLKIDEERGGRRKADIDLRWSDNLPSDPHELIDKYNRGEELTAEEREYVHTMLRDEYLEDPDDEGSYPSELFDELEAIDYDEEQIRDRPDTDGEE